MRKHTINILFIFLIISCNSSKQVNEKQPDYREKCRRLVLSENKIGQEYFFKIKEKGVNEMRITYLGKIKNNDGEILKFINSVAYFGLYEDNKHSNGQIFIYKKDNSPFGFYNVYGDIYVPSKIEGNNLVFDYNYERCNQKTLINFFDSIPMQIFVNCTEKGGDLYYFSTE